MFSKWGIGKKILAGFGSLLVLTLIVGAIAERGLSGASRGFGEYREMARDANLMGELQANMLMVRMNVKDFVITGSDKDIKEYRDYLERMNRFLVQSQKEIRDPKRAASIEQVDQALKDYETGFDKVVALQKERNNLVRDILDIKGPLLERTLTDIMVSAEKAQDTTAAFRGGLALKHLLLARLYATKFLDTNERKHSERVEMEFGKMEEQLNILDKGLQDPARRKMLEELGAAKKIYADAFSTLVSAINERNGIITETLDRIGPVIAGHVQDVKLDIKGVQDTLGPRLVASNNRSITFMIAVSVAALVLGAFLAMLITRGITSAINRTIEGLSSGAEQVASASEQVAASSQSLAEGASQQAAAIEETSASLEEMSSMTKQNAENAGHANTIMRTTGEDMNQATAAMNKLIVSMNDIASASEETQKIVKTIDEIAFQTNLLALNAAVEAARAGEAGAGFAVVADEVRNLAMRAADAAKNTADLIEGTVKKVADGSELVSMTGAAFDQVVAGSKKIGELVAEIAGASDEQAQGIDQVSRAASEMDKVTQQNAANAEESASASEEMTAQAEEMKSFVADLQLLVDGAGKRRKKNLHNGGQKAVAKSTARPKSRKLLERKIKEARSNETVPLTDDQLLMEF